MAVLIGSSLSEREAQLRPSSSPSSRLASRTDSGPVVVPDTLCLLKFRPTSAYQSCWERQSTLSCLSHFPKSSRSLAAG